MYIYLSYQAFISITTVSGYPCYIFPGNIFLSLFSTCYNRTFLIFGHQKSFQVDSLFIILLLLFLFSSALLSCQPIGTSLFSGLVRNSEAHLYLCSPLKIWNESFLQRALTPFSRKLYLEARI